MTGRREKSLGQILDGLRSNEIVVRGSNGAVYLFSKGSTGRVRFNPRRSFGAVRSEIPLMQERAKELFAMKGKNKKAD